MKIAIDGPAASGKGSLSKLLGVHLNAIVLCTGKVYRVAAFANLEENNVNNILDNFEYFWNIYSENDNIFSRKNSIKTSEIAQLPNVRAALFNFQRNFAIRYNPVILEGRDIGTTIMPDADFKFYINVDAEIRAKRRAAQSGQNEKYNEILAEIIIRDKNDARNMKIANDAILVDNNADINSAFEFMIKSIK